MKIRQATLADVQNIQSLVDFAVDPETNEDFDETGVKLFNIINERSEIKARIQNSDYLILCYEEGEIILGLIAIYSNEKIYQLFVHPDARLKGISKQLWQTAKSLCDDNNPGKYSVRSSTEAGAVYKKFGFKLTAERQLQNGIYYYPMMYEQS